MIDLFVEVQRRLKSGLRVAELTTFLIIKVLHIVKLLATNIRHFLQLKPVQSLALLPNAILLLLFLGVPEYAETVLLASVPKSVVLSAIGPEVVAVACFLVFGELALVGHAVRVDVNAVPRHVVVFPLSKVLASILPDVLTHAIYFVVSPVPRVQRAISPRIRSKSELLPFDIVALVPGSLGPDFLALARLQVVLPIADVGRSVFVDVFSEPEAFIVAPFALILVAILVEKCALTLSEAVGPITLVAGTVRPRHLALSLPEASAHASFVY